MDPRDDVLQQSCPTIVVPKYGALVPMEEWGHRVLVARNGLWLEVLRPWLHALVPIASQEAFPLPFGELTVKLALAFGRVPLSFRERFLSEANAALPDEHAAWLVWNENQRTLQYRELAVIDRTPGRIQYRHPRLSDGEWLAVDMHSHGGLPAFFSATDNDDDRGAHKLAIVVGNLGSAEISVAMRLCLGGLFIDLPTIPIGGEVASCDM